MTAKIVGRPFPRGVSGNPGGRPKGLARYVRELVGDDGRRIADFMLGVLDDESERTETRLKAAEWLAERGFGKATLAYGEDPGEPVQFVVQSMFDPGEPAESSTEASSRFEVFSSVE
jgi:hypothetical protein